MNRVALLVEHDRNREILTEWLQERSDVLLAPGEQVPSEPFDLCITDAKGLHRHRQELERRRASEAPCFLPILLLTRRETMDLTRIGASDLVDEFIAMPATMLEFQARLKVLLRNRRQSVELKNQLLDAQRMEAIGILAGGVVHDLNNVLTVVQTCVALLSMDPAYSDGPPEEVAQISDAVGRASNLTRRLLGFSRSRTSSEREVVAPNEIVATTARILEATLGRDIEFRQTLDPDVPSVRCDPVRLEQVIMNLVVNAIDVLPEGGTIELTTTTVDPEGDTASAPPRALLAVRDTGPGMDALTARRIFEPFFTTKKTGTGLGLASVSRIVDDMGGTIEVDTAPGRGTTFRVTLPGVPVTTHAAQRAEEGPTGTPPPAPFERREVADPRAESGMVLVVDDDEAIRRIVSRILDDAGYGVLAVGSAAETLATLESVDVDVILTDSIMPGLSRADVQSILSRAAGRQVAVAFMSGYARDEVIQRLGLLGGAPFLHKPFTPEQLVQTVEALMSGLERHGRD